LDFQPYANLSQVLASADVLVATLESEAGQFAVPSKILSYLCAGRPILLSAPEDNLAAIAVKRSGSGCIAPPDSQPAWVDAAKLLASDASLRSRLGAKARTYAEKSFDIGSIASQFEQVLSGAVRPASEKISSFEEGRATTIQGTLPPLNS
jgi:glycosyltransferase involved in cell wall biosynthesis